MTTEQRHQPDVLKQYEAPGVVVHWEPKLCIHVSNCVRALPHVFNPDARPWVNVEAASSDELAGDIETCHTGTLSYVRTDGTPQETPDSQAQEQYRPKESLFFSSDF